MVSPPPRPKITLADVDEYLDTLKPKDIKSSKYLENIINAVYKHMPKSKLNSGNKLHELQVFVKSILSRKKGGQRKTHRKQQKGGEMTTQDFIGILLIYFISLVILLKIEKKNKENELSATEKQHIDYLCYRSSYDPATRENFLRVYGRASAVQKAYIDSVCTANYGGKLTNMPYGNMPRHPYYDFEEDRLTIDEYVEQLEEWNMIYLARREAGLDVPAIPEGAEPPNSDIPRFTTANAENTKQLRNIPPGTTDPILFSDIENGIEMIELHGDPKHYYTRESMNTYLLANPNAWPKQNPLTRQAIKSAANMKRYKARVTNISKGGSKTHRARKN